MSIPSTIIVVSAAIMVVCVAFIVAERRMPLRSGIVLAAVLAAIGVLGGAFSHNGNAVSLLVILVIVMWRLLAKQIQRSMDRARRLREMSNAADIAER